MGSSYPPGKCGFHSVRGLPMCEMGLWGDGLISGFVCIPRRFSRRMVWREVDGCCIIIEYSSSISCINHFFCYCSEKQLYHRRYGVVYGWRRWVVCRWWHSKCTIVCDICVWCDVVIPVVFKYIACAFIKEFHCVASHVELPGLVINVFN